MAIGFPIIFSEIDKAKSQKEKKELLLKYKSAPLMEILKYTFHPEIKFLLPPGDPPYNTVVDDSENPTYLYGLLRKLYLFVKGGREGLSDMKREVLFTQILERNTSF